MSDETREDKAEAEYQHDRDVALLDGLLTAEVELDCDGCGLNIHVGDPITLGAHGWVHPVCAVEYLDSLAAEHAQDMHRERGL